MFIFGFGVFYAASCPSCHQPTFLEPIAGIGGLIAPPYLLTNWICKARCLIALILAAKIYESLLDTQIIKKFLSNKLVYLFLIKKIYKGINYLAKCLSTCLEVLKYQYFPDH